MKLILQSVQWPPEKSLPGDRNAPEVASRLTVFQNFPYPALSLTRLPPWQPNSAPPTLRFPPATFLKFEKNPVI